MESNVEELEKLKRRLTLELSLEEIEPHYRNVMRQLRSTRLNGFRPGKFPKGWLEQRFKSVMHHEAIENVIPGFIDEALQKNELQQATQAVISELEFESDKQKQNKNDKKTVQIINKGKNIKSAAHQRALLNDKKENFGLI